MVSFLLVYIRNKEFDYHIFIEDDYICFTDYFENDMIKNVRKWNLIDYAKELGEEENNMNKLKENFKNLNCHIPDFSLCIISKENVNKIFNIYSFDSILKMFDIKLKNIWIHQIIFGYILNICNLDIDDISKNYLNIFYHSGNNSISLCNEDNYVHNWIHMEIRQYNFPLFIPIEIILYNYNNDIKLMSEYLIDKDYFITRIQEFRKILFF